MSFELLVGLTAMAALLAAFFWVRVTTSRLLLDAAKLDGTEVRFERSNRRAFAGAVIASVATVVLATAAFLVRQ